MKIDIKTRERALEREQEEWNLTRSDLKQEIDRLTAERDSLDERAEVKRVKLDALKVSEDNLITVINSLRDEQVELEQLNHSFRVKNVQLEEELEMKKTEFDEVLEKRKAEKRKEFEDYKSYELDRINQLENDRKALYTQFENLKVSIDDLKKTQNDSNIAVKYSAEERKSAEADMDKLRKEHEVLKLSLKDEELRAKQRVSDLNGQVADLSSLVNDLKLEGIKLKDYESKAWRILNAKDEELRAREKSLEEREQYKIPKQSLLPPTE